MSTGRFDTNGTRRRHGIEGDEQQTTNEEKKIATSSSASATADDSLNRQSVLNVLSNVPIRKRPQRLRVSPFVFFLIPAIFFYMSAVLASYSLHFGEEIDSCPNNLRKFLWGAIIVGYVFLLGFAWMVAGPHVESLAVKWFGIFLFTILLGLLTGLGGSQILTSDTPSECMGSSWYRTCCVITGFYCIIWIALFILIAVELARALCFPSPYKVVTMGIGSGLNKLELAPLKQGWTDVLDQFPLKTRSKKQSDDAILEARKEAAREFAEMERKIKETQQQLEEGEDDTVVSDDIKKDNFFGSSRTEKRRSLKDDDRVSIELQPHFKIKSSSVAPSPQPSDDEGEDEASTPTRQHQNRDDDVTGIAAHSSTDPSDGQTLILVHGTETKPSSSSSNSPVRSQPIRPTSRQVADMPRDDGNDSDDSQIDDPFALKLADNRAKQEQRRAEIAELARATAHLNRIPNQPSQSANPIPSLWPPPPPPPSLPPPTFDQPTQASVWPRPPPPPPPPSTKPTGILKVANSTKDKFKMVDWESASRLEAIQSIESSDVYDGSYTSSGGDIDHLVERSPEDGSHDRRPAPPRILPPLDHRPRLPDVDIPYGPTSTPLVHAPNYDHIASPSMSSTPLSDYPLAASSTMISPQPSTGPILPSADDPNRFSKLMQMRNQQQRQQPGPNPARYHTIMDEE